MNCTLFLFHFTVFSFDKLQFQINGVRKCSIDSQILSLNNLQILNMSNNCIEHLPKRLGDLRLVQLDLSGNKLANTNSNDWDWLDGSSIKSTLQTLNLSDNSVKLTIINTIQRKIFKLDYFDFSI